MSSSSESEKSLDEDDPGNELWNDIYNEAEIDEASDDEGNGPGEAAFSRQSEEEFADFEDDVIAQWEELEDTEPIDPHRVLHVKPGDPEERIEASFESKLDSCGLAETGVAKLLKKRLHRARDLLLDIFLLSTFPHLTKTRKRKDGALLTKDKWGILNYQNGHYDGGIVKTEQDMPPERHGKGITVMAGSEKYEGMYADDMRHGIGIQFWKNGDVYVGGWSKDVMHGSGVYYYYTGAVYTGPFQDGHRHGRGRMNWGSGAFYIGDFERDQRAGKGFLRQPSRPRVPGFKYIGEFEKNHKHGHGRYVCQGQGYYKGQFVADEFDGDGCLKFEDGNVYEGQFRNGRPQGRGTFKWEHTGNKYVGNCWRGRRDGTGELIYQESSQLYNGQWHKNEAHGNGTLYMKSGDEYDGDIMCGMLHGQGKYQWTGGSTYAGNFEYGARHGEGKLSFNGTTECYEGQFSEDVRHGHAKILSEWAAGEADEENHVVSGVREEKWHFGSLLERGSEHVMASFPKVDDIQAWEDFMTSEGHKELTAKERFAKISSAHEEKEEQEEEEKESMLRANSKRKTKG